MATATLYDVLTEKTGVVPNEGETEQDFYLRLKKSLDAMDEGEFDALPEEAQDWSNDATQSHRNNQPIQLLPGCPLANGHDDAEEEETAVSAKAGDEDEDEDDAPRPARGRRSTATAKDVQKDGGKKKTAQTPAPAAARGAATKKPAAAAKDKTKSTAKEQPVSSGRRGRASGEMGVLDLLMEATHANPHDSPVQLKARVEASKPGLDVKIANAIGIKQQYRRFARFFNKKGLFKTPINLD